MSRSIKVTLTAYTKDAQGNEAEWSVPVVVCEDRVEFYEATRDGLTLDWDEWVSAYGISEFKRDQMRIEARETAGDIVASAKEVPVQ